MSYYKVFKDLDYVSHSCHPKFSKPSEDLNLDAMTAAQIEEMKIINALADKEDRLQAFRLKAKQRVKMYSILKSEHLEDQHQKEVDKCSLNELQRPINKTFVKENLKASNPRFGHKTIHPQNNHSNEDVQIEVNENYFHQINSDEIKKPLQIDLSQLSCQRDGSLNQSVRIGSQSGTELDSTRSCSSTSSRNIARALDIRQPPEVLFTPPANLSLNSAPSYNRPQEMQERALYRKVYGELERERVRKQRLQKEAKQKAQKIKEKAELSRKAEERELNGSLWLDHSSENSDNLNDNELYNENFQLFSNHSTKEDISLRLFRAMLSELKERCQQMQLDPPPLCMCWDDVWSADPNLCANNCEFYKNHKIYLNTLQSLIDSISKR